MDLKNLFNKEKYESKESNKYKGFSNDLAEHRLAQWSSVYYQVSPIVRNPDIYSVLEFGSGRGLSKAIAMHYGISYKTVDAVDNHYTPDEISDIENYPLGNERYDLVCSFQCLEHNTWEKTKKLLKKMSLHSKKYVYISVPHSGLFISFFINIRLPRFRIDAKHIVLKLVNPFANKFPNWQKKNIELVNSGKINKYAPHYWELGMKNFPEKKIINFCDSIGLELDWSKRNPTFPHHSFLMFKLK